MGWESPFRGSCVGLLICSALVTLRGCATLEGALLLCPGGLDSPTKASEGFSLFLSSSAAPPALPAPAARSAATAVTSIPTSPFAAQGPHQVPHRSPAWWLSKEDAEMQLCSSSWLWCM